MFIKQNDKILILGAKGNLGRELARVLGNDYRLILWDREEIDITDKELVADKIKEIKPNFIINAAAYNAVDKCEESEDEFDLAKKVNGEAVGYLAEIAIEIDAILVHYSSDYVFSGENKKGYKEDDKPSPVNKYGESKLLGEKELIKRSGQGLKWYLVRTSKLFGPEGESGVSKPSFFSIMHKLSEKREVLDVIDEEVSCFTYTTDLASSTKELIESGKDSGIYHIINSGPCTWYEAAKTYFKLAGIKVKVKPVKSDKFPRPAKRPKYSVLLNTKLKPLQSYEEALKEYLESLKK
ncbi:dTDP-4-dehydrorhamnose reductase [Candidatus Falkowbacteria bacterium]|nr:MAG: dTDP-4-dehydrorhamnose reductase [Candidatus Falkowbacteria bacterium]